MLNDKSDPFREFRMASSEDCYAVFVTDVQLVPASSGNRGRILSFIQGLRELGWKVALVAPPDVVPVAQLRSLVDDFLPVPAQRFSGGHLCRFDASPFRRAVNAMAARVRPLVAIAQYAWLGPALLDLPGGVQRWIDCHDVLHERTQRFGAAGLHPWAICTWKEELQCLQCADVLIMTQERETALVQRLMPDKKVKCVLTPIDLPPSFSPSPGKGTTVLTVGAHHPGNLAVADFARDAWPRVLERIPSAQLHVVGGIGEALSPTPGIKILGWVPDLQAQYAAAAVVVCPVTTGTGVKTKMLEALRFGKAVVATTAAVEGMPAPKGLAWIVADSLASCADAVADVLADSAKRAEMEAAAFAFGEEYVAVQAFRAQLRSLLTTESYIEATSPPRDQHRSVTVVVPHAGRLGQLRSCLKSLAHQSYPRWLFEVIVVAPAVSPVEYAAIADEFPGTVMIREPRPGAAVARNRGAFHGRNAFVAFLDSDCRVHREWLECAVGVAEEQSGECVVACTIRPIVRSLYPTGVALYDTLVLHELPRAAREHRYGTRSILMRRSVWEFVGPFDEEYSEPSWEAQDWLEAAVARGVRIVNAPGAIVVHPVKEAWAALRRRTLRLARGDRLQATKHGDETDMESKLRKARRERLREELRLALRSPHVPWSARLGVAIAAALVWRWSVRETGIPPARLDALTAIPGRIFGDNGETSTLPLRSVSVIVPSFGWPETLPACLHAVQKQIVDVPVEVIVVVNGPDPFLGDLPGIRVVREPIGGPAAARNAGVQASSGDVLAFIDSDCVPSPRWLAAGLAHMRSGAAENIIAGAITRSGARRSWSAFYDSVSYLQQEAYVHSSAGFVTANLLLHRDLFNRIGPFDLIFNEAAFEDQEWAMRAQALGIHVTWAADAIVDHPCMLRLGEVRRKAERLARGALLMQRKLGRTLVVPSLCATLRDEARKAFRDPSRGFADHLCLICVGTAAGFWGWRAGRKHRSIASGQ
jgi:glycosyltransferase involved in cell wall biosynthesis